MMLYVHLPFCLRKCLYCDFVSFPGREGDVSRYVDALLCEAALRPSAEPLTSLFLGGGTPSLLPSEALCRLLQGLRQRYTFTPGMEITSEANPGALSAEWLCAMREAGVNRLSLGVQAAQNTLLSRIGRLHSVEQAALACQEAHAAGFDNLSLDLMYALPGQTLADWEESLAFALDQGVTHLSCYALTIEENTPFGRQAAQGRLPVFDEELELAMVAHTEEKLANVGIYRYEVSNYARPGCESRHNLGYWERLPYIGLGCAAHSFVDGVRSTNVAELDAYMNALHERRLPVQETQRLTAQEAAFETLMLGLRKVSGVALTDDAATLYGEQLQRYAAQDFLTLENRHVALTAKGFPVMNALLVELLR